MSRIVNLALLAEPVNWLSIAVIIALGGYALALITHTSEAPATKGK